MSQIKISQLPQISSINANTELTVFAGVDLVNDTTGQISAQTLANNLFTNTNLAVGPYGITLSNTVAQFSNSDPQFLQVNLQNQNALGSGDYIVTADLGTQSGGYIDLGINNSQWNSTSAGQTSQYPYDGYLIVDGPNNSPNGNLIIGTANPGTNVIFAIGGYLSNNISAIMTANGLSLNTQSYIVFGDGTTQTTAAASNAYTQAAFALANSASANTITQSAVNLTQNTNITASFTQANAAFIQANTATNNANNASLYANAAFTKANNALANTTGTFAGDLSLTGNLTAQGIQSTTGAISTGNLIVNGTTTSNGVANIIGTLNVSGIVSMNAQVVLTNTSFSATQAALTIAASPSVATPSQDGYMVHISGKQNVSSRIVTDSYGANTYVLYAGRSARGNVSYPSAVKNGDVLSRFSGNGYGTTGYAPLGTSRIDFVATEDYTDSARGSQIQFFNMIPGTNTINQIASFNATDVIFTGEVNPQKGFVLTPNVLPGLVTSLSVDIANNSLYYFKTNNTTSISLSGFKTGKIIEVWITNTDTGAGSNHTITHGCLANNSTIGATSFTLTSLHSAYIKYFSIDGDQANVFCQISYS